MSDLPPGLLRTRMGVFVLEHDTHLSRWVENSDRLDIQYNLDAIRTYAHLIPEGGTVLEAGACIGDCTVTYSQIVGPQGHVVAFEPHPLSYRALERNVARLSNVVTVRAALGEHERMEYFSLDPNIGASYLSTTGQEAVPVIRLDNWLQHRVDFIHLDAEGGEPAILWGADKSLQQYRPILMLEVCRHHLARAGSSEADLLSLLDRFAYTCAPVPGRTHPEQYDLLCLPR